MAKERYEEEMEGRRKISPDLYVCAGHFQDYAIEEFISKNAKEHECGFCENGRAVELNLILDIIDEGICIDYEDVYSGEAIWDSEKKAFDVDTFDIEELLQDEIGLNIYSAELIQAIEKKFSGIAFCKRNPYGKDKEEQLAYDWYYFSHLVKYKTRFLFYHPTSRENDDGFAEINHPASILNDIGKAINELRLYTLNHEPLFSEFSLFRARQHEAKEKITHFSQIGPAPSESASANRFSPAGIPIFYGSEDEKTAIGEVIDRSKQEEVVSSAIFQTIKPLNLIDLTAIRYISPFDLERNKYIFDRSGAEHIDYIPSQIITEYFRHVMPNEFNVPIVGLKYYSSKDREKICYALFLDEDDMTQNDEKYDSKKSLCLVLKSLRTYAVTDIK